MRVHGGELQASTLLLSSATPKEDRSDPQKRASDSASALGREQELVSTWVDEHDWVAADHCSGCHLDLLPVCRGNEVGSVGIAGGKIRVLDPVEDLLSSRVDRRPVGRHSCGERFSR